MKTLYTQTEAQTKLNGYIWNAAELLQSITGKVNLDQLKKFTSEFISEIKQLGATDQQVKKAMFFVCTNFDIEIS